MSPDLNGNKSKKEILPGKRGIKKCIPEGTENLRRNAEELYKKSYKKEKILKDETFNSQRLLQELRVHQIELEAQNDQLRIANAKVEQAFKKYSDLYDFAPIGYFTLNVDFIIIDLNLAGSKMLGMNRQKLIKRNFIDFILADKRLKFSENIGKVFSSNKSLSFESVLNAIGKQLTPVRLEAKLSGDRQGCLLAMIDISRLKEAQEVVTLSEKKYRNLFNLNSDALFLIDHKTGNILDANSAASSMYGYSYKELLKMKNTDLSAQPEKTFISTKHKIKNIPLRYHIKKDGSIFPVEINVAIFYLNGHLAHIPAIRDITERIKTEEKIKNMQTILKSAIESPKLMSIFGIDKDYRYLFFNRKHMEDMKDLYGKEIETGVNLFNYFTSETDKANATINFELALNGESHTVVQQYGSRKRAYFEIYYSPIFNEDNAIIGATVFALDITKRKKKEEDIVHITYHDSLTGLYNRTFLEEEKKRLDTKRQLPISVILGDLNGLKLINDSFGHHEGDNIIREAARVLKSACRSDDIVARWGGDEFIILLPRTSDSDLEEIFERITIECRNSNSQKIPLSISLGASTKTEISQNIDSVIIDAEKKMYLNKLAEKESLAGSFIAALERKLSKNVHKAPGYPGMVKELARKLGKSLKLPQDQLDDLFLLATLHDIGEVTIPEAILMKKNNLSKEEWEIIKRHPAIGFSIAQASGQISHIAKSILSCHENWDGSGYPKGLKGEAIPLNSRIISIIDAYEAMINGKVYKKALSKAQSIEELKRCAGTQFDPALVEKLIKIIAKENS